MVGVFLPPLAAPSLNTQTCKQRVFNRGGTLPRAEPRFSAVHRELQCCSELSNTQHQMSDRSHGVSVPLHVMRPRYSLSVKHLVR